MSPSSHDDLSRPLDFPLETPPADGSSVAVEPGVLWMRLPLPFRLDHVNVWALEGRDGWTIVDTGLDDTRTREAWRHLLGTALGGRPVTRIVATHFHPDHIGLASWLVERTGATFACGLTDWLFARALSAGNDPAHAAAAERFYRRTGLDETVLAAVVARGNAYKRAVPAVPPVLTRLRHGDSLAVGETPWRVVTGAGHTPEPVCLFRPDGAGPLLIPGDQVLPRISPNISVWPSEPDADPLTDYLNSFESLLALPEDTLVLPSHGLPFRGLHRRLAVLRSHHEERLTEIADLCATPRTAAQIAAALFPADLDTHQTVFAVGEAVAHLNHLLRRGTLTRTPGPDGADRYLRAAGRCVKPAAGR